MSKSKSKRDPQRTSGPVRVVKPARKSDRERQVAAQQAGKERSLNPNGTSATERLSKPRTTKPTHPCVCGCDVPTKRVFAPGHDAKVYAILRKVRDGEAKPDAVPVGVRKDASLMAHMLANVS